MRAAIKLASDEIRRPRHTDSRALASAPARAEAVIRTQVPDHCPGRLEGAPPRPGVTIAPSPFPSRSAPDSVFEPGRSEGELNLALACECGRILIWQMIVRLDIRSPGIVPADWETRMRAASAARARARVEANIAAPGPVAVFPRVRPDPSRHSPPGRLRIGCTNLARPPLSMPPAAPRLPQFLMSIIRQCRSFHTPGTQGRRNPWWPALSKHGAGRWALIRSCACAERRIAEVRRPDRCRIRYVPAGGVSQMRPCDSRTATRPDRFLAATLNLWRPGIADAPGLKRTEDLRRTASTGHGGSGAFHEMAQEWNSDYETGGVSC